ncbi:MAG: hypothetical protein LBD14_07080 [Puniceicoccales bacterium]|nr:hypothetical protein [Puniceicoccales bacterium]
MPGLNGQVWLSPKWQDILPPTIEFDPKRAIPSMPRQREKRGVENTRAPAQGVLGSGWGTSIGKAKEDISLLTRMFEDLRIY